MCAVSEKEKRTQKRLQQRHNERQELVRKEHLEKQQQRRHKDKQQQQQQQQQNIAEASEAATTSTGTTNSSSHGNGTNVTNSTLVLNKGEMLTLPLKVRARSTFHLKMCEPSRRTQNGIQLLSLPFLSPLLLFHTASPVLPSPPTCYRHPPVWRGSYTTT